MNSKNHLNFIIASLLIIGFFIFLYKILVLNFPLSKNKTTNIWKIEAEISITPDISNPIKINLLLPENQKNFKIIDEKFISPNYGQIINEDKIAHYNSRINIWTKRRSKNIETLFYNFSVIPQKNEHYNKASPELSLFTKYKFQANELTAAKSILKKAREESADSPSFAANVVNILQNHHDYNSTFLLSKNYTDNNIAKITSRILSLANIKSRIIDGIQLKQNTSFTSNLSTNIPLESMLQIWNGNEWITLDIKNKKLGLPKDFFIWSYDNKFIMTTEGTKNASILFSFKKAEINPLSINNKSSFLDKFSLLNLPIKTQKQFSVLITLPLGILIILILRSIIGLSTIGTFMPVLIALAFRETGLMLGLTSFIIIISFGLILRFYLENLKLLAIPRLGSILAIVILIILFISIIFNELHIANPAALSLFPLVIITMTIERMAVLWEERGASASIYQCIGSLIAASITYLIINQHYLKHLFFVFPELLFVTIALILLIGKYRGFRLSEVILFNQLIKT